MSFLWGAATSSHQIDGDNFYSDWWQWEKKGNIETGEISGRACDHKNRFKEDLYLAKTIGLNSYRFSIEWAKCEPKEGHWNLEEIEWLDELISECEKNKIVPMATLHHFTLPMWVADKGGLLWQNFPQKFGSYVKKLVRSIGSRIPLWCTINEPMVLALGQYIAGIMPPALMDSDAVGVSSRNLFLAHLQAYEIIHSEIQRRNGPSRNQPLSVGIAHNLVDFLPMHHWHPMERLATQILRKFYNQSWLDAVTGKRTQFGIVGVIKEPEIISRAIGKRSVDFIGINYYMKGYVRWNPKNQEGPTVNNFPIGVQFYHHSDKEVSDVEWAVHPEGLGRMIRFVKGYGLPIYITENGIADETDKLRSKYLILHLQQIAKEIESGADIRGYFHWSLLDNFEWIKGFKPRFGLIEIDYENYNRKLKPSAYLYQKIIESHQQGIPSLNKLNSIF